MVHLSANVNKYAEVNGLSHNNEVTMLFCSIMHVEQYD